MSPLYDYHCTECLKIFEQLAKFEDEIECPCCGCVAVKRPTAHGGYVIHGDNGSSTRPNKAGSFGK